MTEKRKFTEAEMFEFGVEMMREIRTSPTMTAEISEKLSTPMGRLFSRLLKEVDGYSEEQIKMFNIAPPFRGEERAEFFMSFTVAYYSPFRNKVVAEYDRRYPGAVGEAGPFVLTEDLRALHKQEGLKAERRFYRARREWAKNERWKARHGSYPKGVK